MHALDKRSGNETAYYTCAAVLVYHTTLRSIEQRSMTPYEFSVLIILTGSVWYSAVWGGALSAVVVGGFSDSGWAGAHTPGRSRGQRGEENQVMLEARTQLHVWRTFLREQ